MQCVNCGAQLRPNARFCNVCGAEQPIETTGDGQQAALPNAPANAPADASTDTEGQTPDTEGADDASDDAQSLDGAGKQKRPPRIPRHRDDDDALDSSADVADVADVADADTEHTPAAAPTAVAEHTGAAESAPAATETPADEGETLPETPNAIPLPDMPTLEQPAVTSITDVPKAEPLDAPLPPYDLDDEPKQPAKPAAPTLTDGMPWPLPPNIIVGGRYRVEELVRSSQTEQGPENVYRARDLQAYEKCWSCGAQHENATALDPYCDQCGADMLAREFVLIERLTSDVGDAPSAAPAAPGSEDTATETDGEARIFTQGMRSYSVAPKAVSAIHFPTGVRVSGYVTADDGRTRHGEANEDSAALLALDAIFNSRHEPRVLGIVADGLGGHDSGQEASKLVVRVLLDVLAPALVPTSKADGKAESGGDDDKPAFDGEKLLREAASAANVALCAANDAQQADMGSTLVAALIVGEMAWIANMGDSRGYVYDDHGLRRVTKDHSLVEQLIDAGMITPEERYEHPQRNQILKSLGADPRLEADIFPQELRPGTRILLCSDGVWEMVHDDELARILRETSSTAEASERIVRAANDNGGDDNISVVLLDASAGGNA